MKLTRRAVAAGLPLAIAQPALAAPLRLGEAAARAGLRYGTAIEPQTVENDPAFAALVLDQCDLITPENALKWNALRPDRNHFDFAAADRVAAFARRARAPMHGHTLVWHEAIPDWAIHELKTGDPRALLVDHITTVVRRYAGRVVSWDVINEPVERNDRRPDGLRKSPWFEALGPDYLEIALRAAHAADPKARLAIADYGLEYDDIGWMVEKRGTMLDLLRGLKSRGVPLHALALQGHLLGDHPPAFGAGLSQFLRQVAALGLAIYVTELDVNDQHMAGDIAQRDRSVAEIYAAFVRAVATEPATQIVVTWGLADRYTSKVDFFPRPDGKPVRPLPFDADLRPKPAAQALADAFASRRRS
ncbi:endo-1,4-beta-xylanase [Phenylobacterium aquaticum]|uniref:endo-1,4-beta-xylanase n=1 Tax=Phenylobacterium aquaticum TaxID=1763816 RepID=UPI0026ED72B4|nr:endo-1,4-beta-xylanase [Phenylobacterium aquaticum]